jgi:hypothetical protein
MTPSSATRILSTLTTLLLTLGLITACGGQDQPGPGGPGGPGPGDPPVGVNKVALQTVVQQFLVPKGPNDFARDIDGDGVQDNKLGQIANAIDQAAPGMNWTSQLQSYMADSISRGTYLAVMQVLGASTALDSQPAARVKIDLGLDPDGNPADNFSGSEELGLNPSSPGSALNGSINGGNLRTGPGEVSVPFVVCGGQLLMVPFKQAMLTGKISPAGISGGQLNGAVSRQDMDSKLLPAFAAYFTESLKTITDPANKAMLQKLFDPNADGTVTAAELKGSIVGIALQPDVDTNGDGIKDAISGGFGFTSVPCVVK